MDSIPGQEQRAEDSRSDAPNPYKSNCIQHVNDVPASRNGGGGKNLDLRPINR